MLIFLFRWPLRLAALLLIVEVRGKLVIALPILHTAILALMVGIPIDFNALTMRSALSSLPVDPTNNTSSGLYYLFAVSTSKTTYELNAKMESTNNASLMSNDGGSTSSWYEIGSDLYILN